VYGVDSVYTQPKVGPRAYAPTSLPCFVNNVNNVLIKTTPLFNQSFLPNAPNRIVHRIEIWTVRWPIQWVVRVDGVGCLS